MTNKLPVVGKRYRSLIKDDRYEIIVESINNKLYYVSIFFRSEDGKLYSCLSEEFWDLFEELPEDKVETINCGNISCKYKSECDSNKRILPKNDQIYIKRTRYARIISVDSEGLTYLEQDGKEVWDCFKDFLDFFEPVETETELDIGREILNSQSKDAYNKAWSEGWAAAMESKRDKTGTKPMDLVKNALKEGIKEMKQFNEKMEKEYPNCRETEIKPIAAELMNDYTKKTSEDVLNNKIDELSKKIEEESIWKPVSELPEYHCQCITLSRSGQISLETYVYPAGFTGGTYVNNKVEDALIHKYIILTDFINDYEKLKETVRKLKNDR